MLLSGGTRASSIAKASFVVKPPNVLRNSGKLATRCAFCDGPFSAIPINAAVDVVDAVIALAAGGTSTM